MAKAENRKAQASPFGLGFSIGMQSVLVDHGGTSYLEDDEYSLITDNGILKLKHVENNRFITEKGDPWIITRDTATIEGRICIIGWTIIREDGTVYRFGDFSTR